MRVEYLVRDDARLLLGQLLDLVDPACASDDLHVNISHPTLLP